VAGEPSERSYQTIEELRHEAVSAGLKHIAEMLETLGRDLRTFLAALRSVMDEAAAEVMQRNDEAVTRISARQSAIAVHDALAAEMFGPGSDIPLTPFKGGTEPESDS
jgi:hypothetical protein